MSTLNYYAAIPTHPRKGTLFDVWTSIEGEPVRCCAVVKSSNPTDPYLEWDTAIMSGLTASEVVQVASYAARQGTAWVAKLQGAL